MKLQLTVLALALVAAPAFAADDARTNTRTEISNDISVRGHVAVTGKIDVNAESAATIDQDQATTANTSYGDGDATAGAHNNAGRDAQGNVGLNIAAGVGNAQSNDVALSAVDGSRVFATAMSFNTQGTFGNRAAGDGARDVNLTAAVDGNVLRDAKGNIGVNVAAGVGNAQSNSLAASVNTGGGSSSSLARGGGHDDDDHDRAKPEGAIAKATADSEQLTLMNVIDPGCGDLDTSATMSGNALRGAQGNVGVNIAAGVGNAQHNGLSIAVAN
jgi:hypothetical protein